MPEQTAFPHRRVGLVEDHESVAIGVSVMLEDEPDLELVCIATTVSEMLAQNVALDLAILDLRLADGSSPKSNVEQLRAAGLETLIFTGAENPYLVRSAARAGVLGVVRKSEPTAVVVDAYSRRRVGKAGGDDRVGCRNRRGSRSRRGGSEPSTTRGPRTLRIRREGGSSCATHRFGAADG